MHNKTFLILLLLLFCTSSWVNMCGHYAYKSVAAAATITLVVFIFMKNHACSVIYHRAVQCPYLLLLILWPKRYQLEFCLLSIVIIKWIVALLMRCLILSLRHYNCNFAYKLIKRDDACTVIWWNAFLWGQNLKVIGYWTYIYLLMRH